MLRHGLMGTFSFSLALWLNTIFDVPQYAYSFFFAVLLVYFDFAERLWQQLIDIFIVGNLIGLICLYAAVISSSAYLSLIYFIILATSLFTLGQYSPKLSLFAIFSIYMLSFSSQPDMTWYDGLHRYLAMFVGMSCAMVSVSLFSILPKSINVSLVFKKWYRQLQTCLTHPVSENSHYLPAFNELSSELIVFLRNKDEEISLVIEDLNKSYTLLMQHIAKQDEKVVEQYFAQLFDRIFTMLHQKLEKNEIDNMGELYDLLLKQILILREQNIIQQLVSKQRLNLASICLYLEQTVKMLQELMQFAEVQRWLK